MPPPQAAFAEVAATQFEAPRQSPEQIADAIQRFIAEHPEAAVLEDGKTAFELGSSQHSIRAEHGRCTLHLWSGQRNLVRTIVASTERPSTLRLSTQRFGHAQTKLLEFRAEVQPRTVQKREPTRKQYLGLLQRVLTRELSDWQPDGFRAAMDLERSFGPAYIRGSLVRANEAWAVIGVGATESQAIIDGVLTVGILWLHHCRERGDGRRLYKGLKLIVPRGSAMVTLARLHWMSTSAGQWQLYELDERTEELIPRDPADQGNLRTRLVHAPDHAAARERFDSAIHQVMQLVPPGEEHRVEQRLRSSAELAFLLHGLEFARARISLAPGTFAHTLEITAGHGPSQMALTSETEAEIRAYIADLFWRRDARAVSPARMLKPTPSGRSIGPFTGRSAHARVGFVADEEETPLSRLELRDRAVAAQGDPLFRAAPERWLESVLRENLVPLTRRLGPSPDAAAGSRANQFANDPDPDTRGNRAEPAISACLGHSRSSDRIIPRFDPRFVYSQVPAIAGASDRGLLDLLGVTTDGRLAVIELKASDDLQMVLQGLDYWIRVRHHAQSADGTSGAQTGVNDLQQHGYFRDVELSPLPPRLYLVAPALHMHPATETILRFLSPQVEWTLLAIDERWRQQVRVVWRKSGGRASEPRR